MSKPIVSVIVPVYNTEKYIGKCLDSLLNQSLMNIEVICVNDGSEDDSLEVLKKYEKKDSRIIIINQTNSGSASARNAGLKVAQGMFIGFIDSDDYAEQNMYEVLVSEAKRSSADVVVCGANIFPDTPHAAQWLYDTLSPSRRIFEKYEPELCFSNIHTNNFLWRTLIRTQIIRDNNISFEEDLKLGEDKTFLCDVYPCAKKVSVIPDKLYNYCWHREGSLMDTLAYVNNDQKLDKHCLLVERLASNIGKRNIDGEQQELLQWIIPFLYGDFIYQNRNDKILFAQKISDSVKKLNLSYILPKLPPYMVEDYNYIENHRNLKNSAKTLCSMLIYLDSNSKYISSMIKKLKKIISMEIEVILINNGVPGVDYEYIKSFLEEEANVRLYNTPNHMKRNAALNKGIALADGKYFMFLESHDKMLENVKLENVVEKALEENADICVLGNMKSMSCYGSEHKNILYRTEWIKEKQLILDDSFLMGKIFLENACIMHPKMSKYEEKIIESEQQSNIERFGGIESGKYLSGIKKLVFLAKKSQNRNLYEYAYKLLCTDLSKNLVVNDLRPNADYYLDDEKNSNQITTIQCLFELVSNFDKAFIGDTSRVSEDDIYEVLFYVINERERMLSET